MNDGTITAGPSELMRQAMMTIAAYRSGMEKEAADPVAAAILALACTIDFHTATMAREMQHLSGVVDNACTLLDDTLNRGGNA